MTLNTRFGPFLPVRFLLRNQLVSLMGTPLYVTVSFSLDAFKMISLCLILGNVIMVCPGVCFLGSKFFGTLQASWTSWKFISFARLGKFSFIMFSNKFSISCSSSSLSGTPMIQMLEQFKVVLEVPKPILIFLNSCFHILFWLNIYFLLVLQIIDLSSGFLPITLGSLYIFLYFTLHSLHFFLYFCNCTQ